MSRFDPFKTLELIKNRRTIRKFDNSRPVPDDALQRVLEAGIWAPYSPYYIQGWKFVAFRGEERDKVASIIIRSRAILKYLRYMYEHSPYGAEHEGWEEHQWKEYAHEFARTLGNAPVIILGYVPKDSHPTIRFHLFASAFAASQNMMLQAAAEGLGSGLISFRSPHLEAELVLAAGLDIEKWNFVFAMNLGYAAERPSPSKRQDGLYEIRG